MTRLLDWEDGVFIDARLARKLLGVSDSTLCYWRLHKRGPKPYLRGNKWFYRRAEIDAYKAGQENDDARW